MAIAVGGVGGGVRAGGSRPGEPGGGTGAGLGHGARIPANKGALALEQSLIKLRTRASLMMIVAHPDDEDGGMLTYEARGMGAELRR